MTAANIPAVAAGVLHLQYISTIGPFLTDSYFAWFKLPDEHATKETHRVLALDVRNPPAL